MKTAIINCSWDICVIVWWTRDSLDINFNFFVKLFNKIKWCPGHSINHNFEWLTFWRLVKSEMTWNWLIPWCPNIVPYPGVITKTITFLSQVNKKLQSVTPHIMWLAKQPILRYCQKIWRNPFYVTAKKYIILSLKADMIVLLAIHPVDPWFN